MKKTDLRTGPSRKNTAKSPGASLKASAPHPALLKFVPPARTPGIRGAEVNILFTDDASIREINREYREIDRVTDVLSFPFNDFTYGRGTLPPCAAEEATALLLLGDIVVSIPAVKRQAKEYGHSEERECAFLICHGMLHLLGYDHTTEEEEQQMFGFADEILAALRYTRDAGSV